MNSTALLWIKIGACLGGLAVIMGAFGAHGIDSFCAEKYKDEPAVTVAGWEHPLAYKRLNDFNTAARYQMYHALALLAVGLLLAKSEQKSLLIAAWSFLIGTLIFSGTLYALTFTGLKILGAITPIGGLLLILGWAALMWGVRDLKQESAGTE